MEKKRILTQDTSFESDRVFLDRSGVSAQLREVLTKMIENRPENPIVFLSDFFEGQQGGTLDRVAKAQQQLTTTHYSKPAFHNNVRTAFDLLSYHKRKSLKGVTGTNYMELLNLLTEEFPAQVKEQLLAKIKVLDHEVVVFDVFKSAVFTCLVLKDFLDQARALYLSLDPQRSDQVERSICQALNTQLHKAVSVDATDSTGAMEAGHLLGPDKVYSTLAPVVYTNKALGKNTMTCVEFISGAAESFLSKVKTLR